MFICDTVHNVCTYSVCGAVKFSYDEVFQKQNLVLIKKEMSVLTRRRKQSACETLCRLIFNSTNECTQMSVNIIVQITNKLLRHVSTQEVSSSGS